MKSFIKLLWVAAIIMIVSAMTVDAASLLGNRQNALARLFKAKTKKLVLAIALVLLAGASSVSAAGILGKEEKHPSVLKLQK